MFGVRTDKIGWFYSYYDTKLSDEFNPYRDFSSKFKNYY